MFDRVGSTARLFCWKNWMRLSPLEERITKIIEPVVTGMGYNLFCVQQSGEGGSFVLQVMAEDPKTKILGVEDCRVLSRAIGAVLDVEDPISGEYRLEVSSPGIDRLLMKIEHYEEYKGLEVKLEIDPPLETQKRFRGRIMRVENGDTVVLKLDKGEVALPFDRIEKAKLVMSDELIKETQKRIKLLKETADEEEAKDHGTAASR
jgi:ribosome maturation factor RimP